MDTRGDVPEVDDAAAVTPTLAAQQPTEQETALLIQNTPPGGGGLVTPFATSSFPFSPSCCSDDHLRHGQEHALTPRSPSRETGSDEIHLRNSLEEHFVEALAKLEEEHTNFVGWVKDRFVEVALGMQDVEAAVDKTLIEQDEFSKAVAGELEKLQADWQRATMELQNVFDGESDVKLKH